jgi:hypothetical protein
LLFVNLVSAERAPFLVSEIHAIRTFVEEGGSLFVITDHSNCYFHAHRLMPLFEELGIRSYTSTACERSPHTLGKGNAWITVKRFKPHPVVGGVSCLAMQVGGCVDPRDAVALTSESSWADAWDAGIYGEENAPGFFGDFAQSHDEPSGPLGVVAAKELGRGRIVIIADQNMLADTFINYADNYRLWLNSIAWLLRDKRLQQPAAYEQSQSPLIFLFETFDQAAFGSAYEDGYYHAMTLLNRRHWTFAGAAPLENADLIIVARNEVALSARQSLGVVEHLRRGKNVLILGSEDAFSLSADGFVRAILQRLPDTSPELISLADKHVIDFADAGKIHVLRGKGSYSNAYLPPPTRAPNPEEEELAKKLLDTVRNALPKKP